MQVRVDAAAGATPADMRLAVIDPGTATDSRREVPAIDTAALDAPSTTTPGSPEAAEEPTKTTGDGEDEGAVALQAAAYTPKPKIFSRAQWGAERVDAGEVRAALLRGARRVRPPHRERQRLHPRPGAGHPARHLRLPHALAGLERHRLQLPGRPVRPDLGGTLRRRRPAGRRRAHPRLQRLRVRDVGDRQLRDRAAEQRGAPAPTGGCSPGSSACTASTPPRPGSRSAGPSSGPSTATATPPPRPVPGATSTPSCRPSAAMPRPRSRAGRGATG